MWRIESQSDCPAALLNLSGRIQANDIAGIQAEMNRCSNLRVLNLKGVTLVDLAVVRFLSAVEREGIQLLDSPAYVREWIGRERAEER